MRETLSRPSSVLSPLIVSLCPFPSQSGAWWGVSDALPEKQNPLNLLKLLGSENAQSPQKVFWRQDLDALDKERALLQEAGGH